MLERQLFTKKATPSRPIKSCSDSINIWNDNTWVKTNVARGEKSLDGMEPVTVVNYHP